MKPISQTWPSSSPQSQAQWSRELREPAVEGVTAASTLPGARAVGFREPLRDEPELDKTVPRFLGAPFSGGEKAKASARAGPWGRRHITGTPQACQRPHTSTGSSRGHHGPANGPARPRGQQARTLAGPGRHPAARGGRPAERAGRDSASGHRHAGPMRSRPVPSTGRRRCGRGHLLCTCSRPFILSLRRDAVSRFPQVPFKKIR